MAVASSFFLNFDHYNINKPSKNNNNMKNLFSIKNFATAVLALGFVFSFTSCEEDLCKDVTCVQGTATESNGSCACVCDLGYEGTTCETLVRAKYLGSFNGNETCALGTDIYAVTIAAGSGDLAVTITNLYGAGLITNGTVNSEGGITIPSQSFGTGTISGSVTRTGGVTTISFTITVSGDADSCSFVTN